MLTVYTLFKFLHIVGAIVWIGGVTTLSVIHMRLARTQDVNVIASLARVGSFYGQAVLAPAAAFTLVAGIVMVASSGLSFGTLWITLGFVAIFVSLALGASLIRVTTRNLTEAAMTPNPDVTHVRALQQRLGIWNAFYLLLLVSAVWAMVFKPTL